MRIDGKIDERSRCDTRPIATLGESARAAEAGGYDGLWSTESKHDPFLPLVAVAGATETLSIGTAITVAFARSPMTLAYSAHDLQAMSGGRFLLGLGSQVRPHIERRFHMPWSQPAARMREFVSAMRAIWVAWNEGEKLDFRGEFYSHTLMTPFFSPAPNPWGPPPVYLAAVGERMTEVAGAVCDGLLPHPFTTERYLRERTLPAVQRGLDGSGWGELGAELDRLSRTSRESRWEEMGRLIDDEVLDTFAVVAEPDRLGPAIRARFGDLVDRFTFYAPYQHDPQLWAAAIEDLRRPG